jgi:virulence-associated protein VagC
MITEEGGTEGFKNNRTEPESNQGKINSINGNKIDEASKTTEEEEDPLQTQQSNTVAFEREGEGEELCEEELVDYDEDPAIAEKIEIAELEKKVESRAQMLLDKAAVRIPVEVAMAEGRVEVEKVSSTPSIDEEIDWDKCVVQSRQVFHPHNSQRKAEWNDGCA